MELLYKALALALAASLFSLTIEKREPAIALLLGLVAVICVLFLSVRLLKPICSFLEQLRTACDTSGQYFAPLLKCLAAAMITKLGSAVCKDAKQNAASAGIEFIGTLAALSAALPLLEAFFSMLEELV